LSESPRYACHICQNELYKTKIIGTSNPASLLRDSQEAEEFKVEFGLGVCSFCKTLNNLNTKKNLFNAKEFEWIVYSEPEYHFENILKKIKANQNDIGKFDYVIGLSYKDASLVEKIQNKLHIKGSCDDLVATTSKWRNLDLTDASLTFTEAIENKTKGAESVLIIARRVLDHCADIVKLLKSLSKIDKKITIYSEFNDYANEIFMGNSSFIWNERTFYPFPSQIGLIMKEAGLYIQEVKTCSSNDNSLIYSIASNTITNNNPIIRSNYNEEQLRLKLYEMLHVQSNFWTKTLTEGKTCVIGASHKGVSFTQIFSSYDLGDQVMIADGAKEKIGKYHPDYNLQIIPQNMLTKSDFRNFVITVDTKWHEIIRQELERKYKYINIYDFEGRKI
jgi:hypothetical protein